MWLTYERTGQRVNTSWGSLIRTWWSSLFWLLLTLAKNASVYHLHQLDQFRIHRLIRFLQHRHQVSRLSSVGRSEERVRRSGTPAATGTSDPMYVILRIVRVIEINDVSYVVHIYNKRRTELKLRIVYFVPAPFGAETNNLWTFDSVPVTRCLECDVKMKKKKN